MRRLMPFEAWHLSEFKNREFFQSDDWRLALFARTGPAFTAIVDKQIIGCAGVSIIPVAHMGMAWASFSTEILKHGLWATRLCRRILEDCIRVYELERVEILVSKDNDMNNRWARTLGFEPIDDYTKYVRY